MRHIFYQVKQLSLETKKEILRDAYSKKYKWWVDKLDCNVSWSRKKIEMSFEDIMDKFDEFSHTVFIHRHDIMDGEYLEAGFSTMVGHPTYYLWILVDIKELHWFKEKYGLVPIML